MTNPCNVIDNNVIDNKDINSISGDCFDGVKRFERDADELAQYRQQIGMAMSGLSVNGTFSILADSLKANSLPIQDLYKNVRSACNDVNNYIACGYAHGYESYVKLFGPIGELRERSGIPTEIKFKPVESGDLIVDVAPEGSGHEVLLDTGAPATVFSSSYASANEAEDGWGDFLKIHQENDGMPVYAYSGPAFELGAIKFAPEVVFSDDIADQLEGTNRKHRLIAILGTDFLLRQPVEINRDRSVIVINQDVRGRLKGGGWSATPIYLPIRGGDRYHIGVDSFINGARTLMLLDTGKDYTTLSGQCEKHFPKERNSVGALSLNVDGVSASQTIPDVMVGFGGKEFLLHDVGLEPAGSYLSETMPPACGLLGNDVFSAFNIIIDPVTMMVYSSPAGAGARTKQAKSLNMAWSRKGNDWIVDRVANGGRAQKAGIKPGDKLVKIDGREAAPLSFMQLSDLAYNRGDGVEIVFERAGKRSTVTIDLTAKSSSQKTPPPAEPIKPSKGCGAHLGARP